MAEALSATEPSFSSSILTGLMVLLVSAIVFGQYGLEGAITRDVANALYSGQQMARGIPPFVSIFNHSGSLGPLLSGFGAWLATSFNLDDIFTIRTLFFVIGSLAATSIYVLGSALFESRRIGLLAAFTLLGFGCFGKHIMTGPSGKVSMMLFETLSLFLMVRRRWFWAAFCSSLAFLAWQPAGLYALVATILAFAQSEPGRKRVRNLTMTVAGASMPLVAVSIYFLVKNAFYQLIDATILFNIYHLDRGPVSLISRLEMPLGALYRSYTIMVVPIFLGFIAIGMIYIWRLKLNGGSVARLISEDRFAPILLSFPAPVIWSLLDFQGCLDFYVFLPYLAVSFSWLLYLTFQRLMEEGDMNLSAQRWAFIVLCVTLITISAVYYRSVSEKGLRDQRRWASQLESQFGSDSKIVSIGVPEVMTLLHRTNPNPYLFIVSGIDNHINATAPGGFDGWLNEMEEYDPDVIALGVTSGRFTNKLNVWLQDNYSETSIGDWKLFVKNTTNSGATYQ